MQQQPIPFQFETFILRVELEADGEPVFHAGDLCAMLGYANPRDALAQHVEVCDVAKRDVTYPEATGKQRKTQLENWVREPGLWSLILGSHAPNAKPIKRWVTAEVLPSIRKTGEYRIKGGRRGPADTGELPLAQRFATNRETIRLMRDLKRETDPAIRRAIHAQLDRGCQLIGIETPALSELGREYVPPPVHPLVVEFWALYAAIGAAALNHSADPRLIAISLTHMARLAAERELTAPPWGALYKALPTSAAPRFLGHRPIHSALNARHNPVAAPAQRRPKTVRCWLFEALPGTEARASPG